MRSFDRICERLLLDSNALSVVLLDGDGRRLASATRLGLIEDEHVDAIVERVRAQATSNQPEWRRSPDGGTPHVALHPVGGDYRLLVLFDDESSLGLVRLRLKKAEDELRRAAKAGPSSNNPPVVMN